MAFRPGAHRRSLVAEIDGVRWVDDSKATNPHAALASIRAHGPVVLIAGGLAKGLDLTPIAEETNVKLLVGIGEAGPGLVDAAGDRGRLAGSLEVAVEVAAAAAEPGDTVLLAPGCASFDQFVSYGARGDRFSELVRDRRVGDGKLTANVTSLAKVRAAAREKISVKQINARATTTILVLVVVLVVVGLGVTMSASSAFAINETESQDQWHFVKRQLIGVGLGTIALIVVLAHPIPFLAEDGDSDFPAHSRPADCGRVRRDHRGRCDDAGCRFQG